ncbi:MAG TPA: transposase [Sedimentisphaerales bacterium]|nr:transposase [Sedimentisphaerales bacterium]
MGYPVGYLITFTTYGTWPHGDERGSVDKEHNRYGSPFVVSNPHEHRREYSTLKNQPLGLSENQREQVLRAIMEVCRFRGWHAYAVHVRSNHVHVVVNGEERPEKMIVDFKAYATRALRKHANEHSIKKYWTRHGSTRYLWTKESVASAIEYVENEQGKKMTFGAMTRQSHERK